MTTIQYVAATALSLVVFVAMANFVVDLYARGVIRAAVDEGARAGAPVDASIDECAVRTHQVLANLLGGASGGRVQVSCREIDGVVHAHADATLAGWLPGIVPSWSFALDGTVAKERDP